MMDTPVLRRRAFLAGVTACTCLSGAARAQEVPPSGAVGLVCSAAGIGGLVFEGEAGATLDPGYRWHIGSNTKAMTAALYARLVDRGRCRWGASVASLFPTLAVHPAWTDIRVEELLSHAAGLIDGFIDAGWLDERRADAASPRRQRLALAERVLSAPPPASRGVYRYGNLNYVLIGAAIEQAVDAAWEDAMCRELFAPLRIDEAGFGAPPRSGPWGRVLRNGVLTPVDPAGVADNPAVLWPSGGVNITPGDYARFLAVFLRRGSPLMRPETFGHFLAPSTPNLRYAGGWSLEGSEGSRADRLAHNGSNTFWFATASLDRRAGVGLAAITNCGGDRGAEVTGRLSRQLARHDPRFTAPVSPPADRSRS